jgi:carbonic anhydrase/acetyltransferase-like protein (isoleucine patch superfamily)
MEIRVGAAAPQVDEAAYVAPTAVLAGDVSLAEGASVWYGAVVRADMAAISLGAGSNLQDNAVIHADPGFPVSIGSGVSIGHLAMLHGCVVEDDCLIGMSSVVMNGARIGRGSIVGAGAVVVEGQQIPPGSLVAGVPARVRRETTEDERAGIALNAAVYRDLAAAQLGAAHDVS